MIRPAKVLQVAGIAAIPATIIATPIASVALMITMAVTNLVDVTRIPVTNMPYVWWLYAWYFGTNARFTGKLFLTFIVPFTFVFLIAVIKIARGRSRYTIRKLEPGGTVVEVDRAESNIHGSARFLEPHEVKQLFEAPDPEVGFFPIAELYRVDRDRSAGPLFRPSDASTWGRGGQAELLRYPLVRGDASCGIVIGGSGTGKTALLTVPALLNYRGSMVVNDPSGTVSAMTARHREEIGHRVVIIDPSKPELGAHNALSHIDIASAMAPVFIRSFVSEAMKPVRNDDSDQAKFFKPKAIAFATAVLADLLYDPSIPPTKKTVREWRERLVIPQAEAKKVLERICATTKSPYAKQIASEMMTAWFETLGSILGQATADTEWLSMGPYADLLSEETFDPTELCNGRTTIYTQFPTDQMRSDPSVARVALGSLVRAAMTARGRTRAPMPFIVDEMYGLKYMQIFEEVRDEGRKWNIPLFPMWQSEQQIEEVWGAKGTKAGKKSWYASAAWRMYLQVDDLETAKELSEFADTYTAIAPSEGDSTSRPSGSFSGLQTTRGATQNLSLQARRLMTPGEVRTGFRKDEVLLFIKGQQPARLGASLYYRRSEWAHLVDPDPSRQPAEELVDA